MRLIILTLFSLITANSFAFDVYFKHNVFYNDKEGSYVETHMLFNAETFELNKTINGFQANIELTYIFSKDDVVKQWNKSQINSPVFSDSISELQDFFDLQRFNLPDGDYNLSIKVKDLNNPEDSSLNVLPVSVKTPEYQVFLSDIIYVLDLKTTEKQNMFSRSGYDLTPRISGFYGPQDSIMRFYAEIYKAAEELGNDQDFLLQASIINDLNNEVAPNIGTYQRLKAQAVNPVLKTIDINQLPTGNYTLKLELRNRRNELFAKQSRSFTRYSHYKTTDTISVDEITNSFVFNMSEDSLREALLCMRPKMNDNEKSYLDARIKKADTNEMKRFVYTFWSELNPINPEAPYKSFAADVRFVKNEFKTQTRHGCMTDRGNTYMKYGKPNTRVEQRAEANASPYEIWHYYKLTTRSNAKFAFVDRSGITNDFTMLHSNVPGEHKDNQWYLKLNNSIVNPTGTNDDFTGSGEVVESQNLTDFDLDEVGYRALQYWNNPR